MSGRRGYALVLGSAVLWGTTGTAQALGPVTSNPIGVGAMRMVTGGAVLVLAALAARTWPARGWWRGPVLMGGLTMAAYQPLFFAGVSRTGVAIGTVVAIGTAPVLAGLLGAVVLREPLTTRWAFATLVALAGVALLAAAGPSSGVELGGLALSAGAGACYAVYAVAAKRVLATCSPLGAMGLTFGWAALLSLPLLVIVDLSWLGDPGGWAMALYLGLVATATAYVLFARGLRVIAVAAAATLTLAEPATASILGITVLGEALTITAALGVATVLSALVILRTEVAEQAVC